MISILERQESLKKFPLIPLKEIKVFDKKYDFSYEPILGLFTITPLNKDMDLPLFAVSSKTLIEDGYSCLSRNDKAELMVNEIRKIWRAMSSKKQQEITNKMPLNSLYLGGDTLY